MLGADGHRQRVLEKFLTYGGEIFADYELLEFILMQSIPRKDVKPLAKELLVSFGSLENVLNAPTDQLKQIKGVGERTIGLFHLMMTVSQKLTKERLKKAPILSDWQSLLDYAQLTYMGENIEKFRVLYEQELSVDSFGSASNGDNKSCASVSSGNFEKSLEC